MFRIIVCGSRDFSDVKLLNTVLDETLERHPDLVIVDGAARGADDLAWRWASDTGVPSQRFPAEWDRYGKSAGPRRNEAMLNSTLGIDDIPIAGVIAFYTDPAHPSRGTSHMVRIAKEAGVRVYIPKSSCWGDGNCHDGALCPACWRARSADQPVWIEWRLPDGTTRRTTW